MDYCSDTHSPTIAHLPTPINTTRQVSPHNIPLPPSPSPHPKPNPNGIFLAQAQLYTAYQQYLYNLVEWEKYHWVFVRIWNSLSVEQRAEFSQVMKMMIAQGINPDQIAKDAIVGLEARDNYIHQCGGPGGGLDVDIDTSPVGTFPFDVEDQVISCVQKLRSLLGSDALKHHSYSKPSVKRTYNDAQKDWMFAHLRCNSIGAEEASREMAKFRRERGRS